MPLRERLLRHRKSRRFLVGVLALLFVACTAVYWLLLQRRELPEVLVENRLLLFALWYANVVLILAVLFVLLRSVAKLLLERKTRILGSQFKTKLVATYFGLSLLPVLALFFIATGLLRSSIDRWFETPLEDVLERGYVVSQQLTDHVGRIAVRDARRVLRQVADVDLATAGERPAFGKALQALRAELELDFLGVYDGTEFVHAVVAPRTGGVLPEPERQFLRDVARDGQGVRVESRAGSVGRLVFGAAAGAAASAEPEASRPVVVAGVVLPLGADVARERLVRSYQSYRQLEALQEDIRASHLLIFLMMTLLVLLAASWTGLHLARRVTVPIQALATGTERLAKGDLSTRVEVAADDELGVLVDSFNTMAAELERNEALLARGTLELQTANQRLGEERALLAGVLENVAAGVVALDAGDRVFLCNRAALQMLRQREDEVLGRTPAEAWAGSERERLVPLLGGEIPAGTRRRSEARLVLGGEWKTFDVKVTAMRSTDGTLRGRILVLEDTTELIEAQQLAAWNEAAKRIAHEIKNPLTPIHLSAERLQRRAERNDPELATAARQAAAIISREVATLKGMVDEFSQYARMPRPQPVEVDLAPLVEETLRLYVGIKPGVDLAARVEEGLQLRADREQLRRALINLLDNAVEATDAPGHVEVAAESVDGRVLLHVRDDGKGIPAAAREKLFLPYFSTKGRGTGLGLAIVHRIVTDHRGTVRVADNNPRGTVFTIDLPAA